MFRVINEYMSKVNLQADESIYKKLVDYLDEIPEIKKSTVTVSFQHYVVAIQLKEFSVDLVAKLFQDFNASISYSYSSLFVRFNEGKCVRYRYITSNENKDAIYCDIIFS